VGLGFGLGQGLFNWWFFQPLKGANIEPLETFMGSLGRMGAIYDSLSNLLIATLENGLILGLLAGLIIFGGLDAIKHYVLRLILAREGYAPLSYVSFLDYATKLIFLRKVGGGYIFIHRMLMEYFAAMGKERG
jgi:hypothetical protein